MLKQDATVRFKMHKVKKQWVVIGTAVTLAATGVALSNGTPVAASTQEPSSSVVSSQTSNSAASEASATASKVGQEAGASSAASSTVSSETQKPTQQTRAITTASSSSAPSSSRDAAIKQTASSEAPSSNAAAGTTTEVHGDDASLQAAADKAKQVGVQVQQDPDKTIVGDDAAKLKEQIDDDYQAQQQQLAEKTAQQEANNQVQQQVEEAKKETQAGPARPEANDPAHPGFTASDTWQNLKGKEIHDGDASVDIYAKGTVNAAASLDNGDYQLYGVSNSNLPLDQQLKSVRWGDVNPQVLSGLSYQWNGTSYNMDTGGTTHKFALHSGGVVLFPGVVTMQDGSIRDLIGQFSVHGTSAANDIINIWNANGAINYVTALGPNRNDISVQAQYWIAKDGQRDETTPYLWVNADSDIDGGQRLSLHNDHGESVLLGVGGGLRVDGGPEAGEVNIKSNPELGDTYGKNLSSSTALDGLNSAPDGTVIYAVLSNSLNKQLYNEKDGYVAALVAAADFAMGVKYTPVPQTGERKEKATYHFTKGVLRVKPSTPEKVADQEGKTLLAGDTTTQHISQNTGNAYDLTGFYVGDAIFKTADGRLPVSYNLSDFNVTDQNGNNVTSLGKFVVSDGTVASKAALLIKWVANEPDKLGDNMTYTLNTELTTLKDGIQDQELDAGITPYGTTDIHHYDEYVPTPDKHWTLDDKVTDNQLYLNGDTATATIKANLPDRSKLQNELSKVTVTDDFSQFADKVTVASVKVLENGTDVSNLYNITINPTNVVLTRKDAKSPAGVLSVVLGFKIKDNVPNETLLTNKGSMTVNTDTETIPPVNIVTWNPKPHKDVELGQVQGDTSATANGQMVANGQQLTYPLSSDDLPANRTTEINDWHVVDHLPDGVQYNGYKAWIKGKDGKLEDITSHLVATATADNQVTYTADAALLARFNADKSVATATPIIDVFVTPLKDGLTFTNEYQLFINKHEVVSNQVTNHTPTPTPHKTEQNADGVTINGKTVLPGSTNSYQLTWNTGAYKGIVASDDQVAKGFGYVEDYPEAALDPQLGAITYKDSTGAAVKGISVKQYASLEDAPTAVQAFLKKAGITPKGAFLFFSVDDPAAFYQDYVVKGKDITLTVPMKVKQTTEGEYENIAYEIDFGNGHATEIIKNNIPKINPQKDVVASDTDNKSLNNGQIDLNGYFDYLLHGPVIEAGNGDPITQYGFDDAYDQKHDQFTGQYKAVLTTDVTLKNGSTLKKGTDITNQLTLKVNADGSLSWEVKADFLAQIDQSKSAFGVDLYAQMKRIASGDVYNTDDATVNGVKYISNRVHTTTPEPAVPVTPEKPVTPAQPAQPKATPQPTAAPVKQALASLPKTGDQQQSGLSVWGALALAATSLFGMLGLRKRRETN